MVSLIPIEDGSDDSTPELFNTTTAEDISDNPVAKQFEEEIIVKEYWQTWLKSMGIAGSQFLPAQDDPQIVIERITEFISPE